MNVSLTPQLEKYVRLKVHSGLYNNASEVIREALRRLLEVDSAVTRTTPAPPDKTRVMERLASLKKQLQQRGLQSVALFGSTARGTARADSDVDVLIDIAPGRGFSLVDLVSVKHFLEQELGAKVDVVIKDGLSPLMRDQVLGEAESVF